MFGAPIGTFLCYLTTMLLNFFFVAKKIGYVPNIGKIFLKPFVSAVLSAASAWGSYKLFMSVIPNADGFAKIITLMAVAVAVVVYLVAIFALKAITKEDITLLPKGEKIAKVLEKRNLI